MVQRTKFRNLFLNQDMTADFSSEALPVYSYHGVAIQAVWTGAPVGVLKMQASCDITDDPGSVTNWDDIGDPQTVLGPGTVLFNVRYTFYKWVRFTYVFSSGTGTLNADINYRGTW